MTPHQPPRRADTTIIQWRTVAERPREGSSVLLQYSRKGKLVCGSAVYLQGRFSSWDQIPEEKILGWSYYPFDEPTE